MLFHLSNKEDVISKARKAILDPLWLSIKDNPDFVIPESAEIFKDIIKIIEEVHVTE